MTKPLQLHEWLTLAAYRVFMWCAQPLLWLKVRRRARQEPGYAMAVGERFGLYTQGVPPNNSPLLWLHAVSLGETRGARGMLQALRDELPNARWLITHSTATGREAGLALMRPGDLQAWLPWDTPWAVERFLARFRPLAGLLMETEVWPELVHQCDHHQIPLLLVNGRLSTKSAAGALRWSWLMQPAYRRLAGVWAQTRADAQRYNALEAPVRGVSGNLKFDAAPDVGQHTRAAQARGAREAARNPPIAVLASSREGEERGLLEALNAAAHSSDAVQWLIVPRHPQRFDDVAALIEHHGWRCLRRSQWRADAPPAAQAPKTIWLGDSMGEMSYYFALSEVALLGGSFEPLGGQNLIEACAAGCPVIMGPSTFNFDEPARTALDEGAALRVSDLNAAVQQALRWCTNQRSERKAASQAALVFCDAHHGAAQRTALAVAQQLQRLGALGSAPQKPTRWQVA